MGTTNPPLTDQNISGDKDSAPHGKLAGNWSDDDAGYVDDILVSNPEVIPPADETTGLDMGVDKIPTPNRLVSRRVAVNVPGTGNTGPQLLMPAQPGRKGLQVMADVAIFIAGDPGHLLGGGLFRIAAADGVSAANQDGTNIWTMDGYTGPVYVQSYTAAAPASAFYASAWAVIEA